MEEFWILYSALPLTSFYLPQTYEVNEFYVNGGMLPTKLGRTCRRTDRQTHTVNISSAGQEDKMYFAARNALFSNDRSTSYFKIFFPSLKLFFDRVVFRIISCYKNGSSKCERHTNKNKSTFLSKAVLNCILTVFYLNLLTPCKQSS